MELKDETNVLDHCPARYVAGIRRCGICGEEVRQGEEVEGLLCANLLLRSAMLPAETVLSAQAMLQSMRVGLLYYSLRPDIMLRDSLLP